MTTWSWVIWWLALGCLCLWIKRIERRTTIYRREVPRTTTATYQLVAEGNVVLMEWPNVRMRYRLKDKVVSVVPTIDIPKWKFIAEEPITITGFDLICHDWLGFGPIHFEASRGIKLPLQLTPGESLTVSFEE